MTLIGIIQTNAQFFSSSLVSQPRFTASVTSVYPGILNSFILISHLVFPSLSALAAPMYHLLLPPPQHTHTHKHTPLQFHALVPSLFLFLLVSNTLSTFICLAKYHLPCETQALSPLTLPELSIRIMLFLCAFTDVLCMPLT